jgi:hypothetical protein
MIKLEWDYNNKTKQYIAECNIAGCNDYIFVRFTITKIKEGYLLSKEFEIAENDSFGVFNTLKEAKQYAKKFVNENS